jgi:hypothetical protein
MGKSRTERRFQQIIKQEERHIDTVIRPKIVAGDCHTMQFQEDKVLTLGGPIRPEGLFLVLRTDKGEVIVTMNRDQIEILAEQVNELAALAAREEERRSLFYPTMSDAMH